MSFLGRPDLRVQYNTVPGRTRVSVELGEAWNVRGDFGLEVKCQSVCAAALVMWDAGYKTAHESQATVGCEVQE